MRQSGRAAAAGARAGQAGDPRRGFVTAWRRRFRLAPPLFLPEIIVPGFFYGPWMVRSACTRAVAGVGVQRPNQARKSACPALNSLLTFQEHPPRDDGGAGEGQE